MTITVCPSCKEEVKKDAIVCKQCGNRIFVNKADFLMNAIIYRLQISLAAYETQAFHKLECFSRYGGDTNRLDICLKENEEAAALAIVAEKLHREFIVSMAQTIWQGGDIDPIPFEKSIREKMLRNLPK